MGRSARAQAHGQDDKVGLIGAGMVGPSFAYALMRGWVANELVLIDAKS